MHNSDPTALYPIFITSRLRAGEGTPAIVPNLLLGQFTTARVLIIVVIPAKQAAMYTKLFPPEEQKQEAEEEEESGRIRKGEGEREEGGEQSRENFPLQKRGFALRNSFGYQPWHWTQEEVDHAAGPGLVVGRIFSA